MPAKTWTVLTPDSHEKRTLSHEQMLDAIFEAVHGFGFSAPEAVAASVEPRERVLAAA